MIFDTIKNIILIGIVGFIILLVIDPIQALDLLIKLLVEFLGIGYDAIVRSLL